MSSVSLVVNLVRLYSLYKILYPERRVESYSIMGTIVSPKKYYSCEMLLMDRLGRDVLIIESRTLKSQVLLQFRRSGFAFRGWVWVYVSASRL